MRSFDEIYALAASCKGGTEALEALLPVARPPEELAAVPDDRWLAAMTRSIFQAGFSWKVIESKWPGFEEAFEGFPPGRWARAPDEDLDRLAADTRIVRNAAKIRTVRDNAALLVDLAREHGSAAAAFAHWPAEEYVGLLDLLGKRGSHLGGASAAYFLRSMGKESAVFSKDMVAALIREGVVAKAPTSKRDRAAAQAALTRWRAESGRSLSAISRVLAASIDS